MQTEENLSQPYLYKPSKSLSESPLESSLDSPSVRCADRATLMEQTIRDWVQPPNGFTAALTDAGIWLGGAIVLRVGVESICFQPTSSLLSWIVGVLILIAPAIALVYLSMLAPKHCFVLVYRSFLIMIGLLMGGRL